MCNALDTSIGVVVGQKIRKELHNITYASRTLDVAQKLFNYFIDTLMKTYVATQRIATTYHLQTNGQAEV
ncbi:hypothetical protein GQ457_05G030330 [Hibiscus cannabinus]